MNLYDQLTQKMYSNINFHHNLVAQLEEKSDEDVIKTRLRQRRKARVFDEGEPVEEEEESEESYSDECSQSKNDLVLRQHYEKYQFLKKHPSASKTTAEHRAFFGDVLQQINRAKLWIASMAIMLLVCTLSLDLLCLPKHLSPSIIILQGTSFRVDLLCSAASFASACFFLTIGFCLACLFPPARHRLRLLYDTTFFIISLTFIVLVFLECSQGILVFNMRILIILPLLLGVKSMVIGYLGVHLLYSLFDCQIVIVKQEVAKRYVRCFVNSAMAGLILALLFCSSSPFGSNLLMMLVLCRLVLWFSLSGIYLLLWYGVSQLNKHTIINDRNRAEFGFYFAIRCGSRQRITLDRICFAAQSTRRLSDHLTEDNCSVRTVKPWRINCIALLNAGLFAFAFGALVFHLAFSFLWAQHYLDGYDQDWQIVSIRVGFLASLMLASKLESLLSGVLVRMHNRYRRDPLKPSLQSTAACLHSIKLIIIYFLAIVAYLSQLFLASFGFGWALITNITLGLSLSLMVEYVPRFTSKFITITEEVVRMAIVATSCYCSLVSLFLHYLLTQANCDLRCVYHLNLCTILLSLSVTINLAKWKCFHSTRSFDLLELRQQIPRRSAQTPEICIEGATPLGSVKETRASTLTNEESMRPANSSSSFYLYQVAVNNTQLASEDLADAGPPPAVVPYRFKLRISSLASILTFRKNS